MSKPKWKETGPKPVPPLRPQHGTVGTTIKLYANHFAVHIGKPDLVLVHYDVTIKDHLGNEKLPKKKKMAIFETMKQAFPKVFEIPLAFDSEKNAYSAGVIPQFKKGKQPITYEVTVTPEARKGLTPEDKKNKRNDYKVTLVKVNQARLKDLLDALRPGGVRENCSTILQMCEVMFRHYRAIKYEQVANRNFYSMTGEFGQPNDIGGGKQGVIGFFASLRPAAWKQGLTLNIDMAHTAFYKEQPVMDFLKEQFHMSDADFGAPFVSVVKRNAEKALKGLRIRVTHSQVKRTYKVLSLTPQGADKLTFELDQPSGQKKTISVLKYFQETYGYTVKFKQACCLHVGNPDRKVYIPLEVCFIDKGQRVQKKLTDQETANFIRSTAIPPAERLRAIKAAAAKNQFPQDKMLQALTFTISDMPLETKGRILPAPNLTMVKTFRPYQGVWDLRDKAFHQGASLKTEWAVINYDPKRTFENAVKKFIDMLVRMGKEKGMAIDYPMDIYHYKDFRRDPNPLTDFQYYKNKNPNLKLIMCILPGRKYYGSIKKAGDRDLDLITQCVLGQNVQKCQPQTIGNILLKINAKMGGTNMIIGQSPKDVVNFNEPFLILGADVNHPPAGDKNMPSLAAVVGSYDKHATKYAVEVRAQTHRTEIIEDMTEIMVNMLKHFRQQTSKAPQRIIMYRDGVSESQFMEVLTKEMLKMREACKQLSPTYTPGITFICVQKRHHTRLFCDERDGIGRSKNVPPGTIVDRDITHPTENDFFLCSHQGIQGTSKPTHYHVLWDDNDLPVDELQAVTYRLCHVYSRCTRSVSIPTPAYYAHLAAFRAKVYVAEVLSTSDSGSTVSGGSGEATLALAEIQKLTRVARDTKLGSDLYYV